MIRPRLTVTYVEELGSEMRLDVDPARRRVVAAAVFTNPYAGRFVAELDELVELGADFALLLAGLAVDALGGPVHSYGKAAIVGTIGEIEHAAALLHPKFGGPLRDACGGGRSIIPSSKKRGGPGTSIDIPLHHKDAAFVRSHFDAIELRVADAPHPDEIVIAAAVSSGGRPLARVGGLAVDEIVGEDGLR